MGEPKGGWGLGGLVDAFVIIVFAAQLALWSSQGIRRHFRQVKGISTGLACGSQLANIFLQELDASMASSFSAEIALYKRYIDDILIVGTYSLRAVLELFNAFDAGIRITHESIELGFATSFLDLYILR